MLASVKTAWLFTRGTQSVRIVRAAREGVMHLIVYGPGDRVDRREFLDVLACMDYQAALERRLVADGYSLERFTSDRRGTDPRAQPAERERRRPQNLFLA